MARGGRRRARDWCASRAAPLQGICSELALVDVDADKLRGERMDLEHGRAFLKQATIRCVFARRDPAAAYSAPRPR